ncbi:MAG: RNA-guided pseudouridylation complex pseudouridine synthase subunit Cbf5, partial [Candidatus Bathyarchaeota archaeon]
MQVPFWNKNREVLIKKDASSDPSHGYQPELRPIDDYLQYGIINLDKPSGPSSHEVVAWIKTILKMKHAGHGGTLDPKVTGVLPVALEEGTKAVGVLLLSRKEYVCVMHLHGDCQEGAIRKVIKEFEGELWQRPPLRSSVRRKVRVRRIYYIRDLEFEGRRVLFRVGCQSGTYIRKLVHDMGEALGPGAHMEELRRTRTGPFTEDRHFSTLYDFKDAYDKWQEEGDEKRLRRVVLPIEKAVEQLPKLSILDSTVSSICHGAKHAVPGIAKLES